MTAHVPAAAGRATNGNGSPYIRFSREEWARLRADMPLTLTEAEVERLRGINTALDLREVEEVYLPLSRLLNLYVAAVQELYSVTATFLGHPEPRVPYIIGLAGSVAVGKSTTARVLQALLSRWPNHPHVELVTTDGYLYPNKVLEERGLMQRKGFPESYDLRGLTRLVSDVKAGRSDLQIPLYSHRVYDILPGASRTIKEPEIVIVEGLNVLQTGHDGRADGSRMFVSDFFDFTIYVDAQTDVIRQWYIDRFMTLRRLAVDDPGSYFQRYVTVSDAEALQHARSLWSDINEVNLRENILPTRERARLILEKGSDHSVQAVWLRKI